MHHAITRPFRSLGMCVLRALLPIALAAILPSCGEMIWTSSVRAATNPEQIQILVKTPPHYERLGTVTHLYTQGAPWQEGADATPILRDLLAESATMGANVLLLVDDTTMADSSITMTYQGKTYTFPVIAQSKTILAQALFVPVK